MSFPFKLPMLLGGDPSVLPEDGRPPEVCPEQWLLEHPDGLKDLQRRCILAGCDGVWAPTCGASAPRLAAYGLTGQEEPLNRKLTVLTRETARGQKATALKGACLGPTGLTLEPYGEVRLEEAVRVYARQAAVLKEAGADFLLCRGMTSLNEARAALLGARLTGLPVLVTLRVDSEGETPTGSRLLPALITLQALGAAGVGLSGSDMKELAEQIEEALPYAAVPLMAVPHLTGEPLSPLAFGKEIERVLDAGASILAGGTGVLPEHLAVARGLLDRHPTVAAAEIDTDAAANEREAFFLGDHLDFSEPLPCDSDLGDALIQAEETANCARVELSLPEDIPVLLEASSLSLLPIAVYTDDPHLLESVLLRYPGRLIVDSLCEIPRPLLEEIAEPFGAIIV
jgi:5-methyltetrahydrofolate--homocysteine methyltransferase